MANRTALKVGALAGLAVVGFFLLQWLLRWVVRLVKVAGVALLAAVLAYVAYRVWAAMRGDSGSEETTTDPQSATADETSGPLSDLGTGPVTDADADDDDEIQRELDELRDGN